MGDRLVCPAGSAAGGGTALVRAAAAAGHGTRVREVLDTYYQPGPADEDADLIRWAADYGAYQVIHDRLGGYRPDWPDLAARDTVEAALRLARGWLGVDAVAELRRRLGDANAVVLRETVLVGEYDHTECVRVTAADGRWAEAQTAHAAIVTYLEDRLGTVASRDELMARALPTGDPGTPNWSQSVFSVSERPDAGATLRWALAVLTDPDPGARRFAAEVVGHLSRRAEPGPEDALAALRTRLSAERDAGVLVDLIAAFATFHGPGNVPEVAAHARHPDPLVRRCVAENLAFPLMAPGSVQPGADVLAELGGDPDGRVRAVALRVLRDHAFDHPVTGRLLAAHRDDRDSLVRVEVLAGLARGGDTAAGAQLRRLADDAGEDTPLARMADDAERRPAKGDAATAMPEKAP